MPSVQKRGSRWYAWIRTPGFRSGKKSFALHRSVTTRKAAERIAAELQDDWDAKNGARPGSPHPSETGWIDLATRVLVEKHQAASEASRRDWIPNLRVFVEDFTDHVGDVPIASITPGICRQFQHEKIRSGANPSTLRKKESFISSIFERAVQDAIIPTNPWARVKRTPEPSSKRQPLTADEFEHLIATAPADRAFRYLFLAFTGCRPGEAYRATWADVDFRAARIRLPNSMKGRTSGKAQFRHVDLLERLLLVMQARRGAPGEAIFPSRHNWLREFKADCRDAGIAPHVVYDLRHSFGTWCAYLDLSSYRIQRMMDHSSERTSARYLHLADGTGTVPRGFMEFVSKMSARAVEWSPEIERDEAV